MSLASFNYQLNRSAVPSFTDRFASDAESNPAAPLAAARKLDPKNSDPNPPDYEISNRLDNMERARTDEVARFVIEGIPDYRNRMLTAMARGDRVGVESLQQEMNTFVNDNRRALGKWTGLRNNGEWGRTVSQGVMDVLSGGYLDSWGFSGADGRTMTRTVGSFMSDTSPEAYASSAKVLSEENAGLGDELARVLVDPSAKGHSVFSDDYRIVNGFRSPNDRTTPEYKASTREWLRTKWEMYRKYSGLIDDEEFGSFFNSWDSQMASSKLAGRDVVDVALSAFAGLPRGTMSANEFVSAFADRTAQLSAPPRTVTQSRPDGTAVSYDVPSESSDNAKAVGVVKGLLSVGRDFGLDVSRVLGDPAVWEHASRVRKEVESFSDVGLDLYKSKNPGSIIAETVLSDLQKGPGAVDRLSFLRDAKTQLTSAFVTDTGTDRVVSAAPGGQEQVTEEKRRSGFYDPVERPLMKAFARAVSKFSDVSTGFDNAVQTVLSDPVSRGYVTGEMRNALSGLHVTPEGADEIITTYLSNFTSGVHRSIYDVLRRWNGDTVDETGAVATEKENQLKGEYLWLGQSGGVVKGERVPGMGTRPDTDAVLTSSDKRFAAELAVNPEKVMPSLSGEGTDVSKAFGRLGDMLLKAAPKSGDLDRAVADIVSKVDKGFVLKSLTDFSEVSSEKMDGVFDAFTRRVDSGDVTSSDILQMVFLSKIHDEGRMDVTMPVPAPIAFPGITSAFSGRSKDEIFVKRRFSQVLSGAGFPKTEDGKIDYAAGIRKIMAADPTVATDSAMFALLCNPDGTLRNSMDVNAMLQQQQRMRVMSPYAKPAEENASADSRLRHDARRLLQVYDPDFHGRAGREKLWEYATAQFGGDDRAALGMYVNMAGQYGAKLRREGRAAAGSWLDRQLDTKFRYAPVIDDSTGAIVPGQVTRSERMYSSAEWAERVGEINAMRIRNRLTPITLEEFDHADAVGPKIFYDNLKEGREFQKQAALTRMRVDEDIRRQSAGE